MAYIRIHTCDVCGKHLPEGEEQPFTVDAFYAGGNEPRRTLSATMEPPNSIEKGACSIDCVYRALERWYALKTEEKAIEAEPVEEKTVQLEGQPC
jgi:hypothetical protein